MLSNPHFVVNDPEEAKRLVRENPWATIISPAAPGVAASHYPLPVEDGAEFTVVTHVGRRIIAELESDGPHANLPLAREMRRVDRIAEEEAAESHG